MDENIKNTYNRIKGVIGEDKILNHYVNNFSQHIYFTEIRKERNILYKYLLNVSETLEAPNNKKMFYFYLKDSYKNKNFGALEVIKSYYK